ncbi:hypothetical protein ACYQOP_14385 [Methylobacterium sp. CM6247]
MTGPTEVLLGGATGGLGLRIAKALRARGAGVKAVVRLGTAADRISVLQRYGANRQLPMGLRASIGVQPPAHKS